jgi:hypothetical protein
LPSLLFWLPRYRFGVASSQRPNLSICRARLRVVLSLA